MIIGPQYDFSDREMQLLRDFWNKQGRILLLLDPAAKTPKLDAFLNELGVIDIAAEQPALELAGIDVVVLADG